MPPYLMVATPASRPLAPVHFAEAPPKFAGATAGDNLGRIPDVIGDGESVSPHHMAAAHRDAMGKPPSVPQDHAGLSHQHEGRVVSQGNCGGDVYGAADQQTRDRGREQPRATRGHRDGDRAGHRHARQVARAHEGREHVAGAPELDAQDGRLGGQKRNACAHRPERAAQQQVEHQAHRGRRDARHGHLPLAAQRGQDAHRHKVADARYEAHRDDGSHCTLSSFTAI